MEPYLSEWLRNLIGWLILVLIFYKAIWPFLQVFRRIPILGRSGWFDDFIRLKDVLNKAERDSLETKRELLEAKALIEQLEAMKAEVEAQPAGEGQPSGKFP